jgi:hypothetical protein
MAISAAHPFYFFTPDARYFKTKLEMFAENTLDFFKLFLGK